MTFPILTCYPKVEAALLRIDPAIGKRRIDNSMHIVNQVRLDAGLPPASFEDDIYESLEELETALKECQ